MSLIRIQVILATEHNESGNHHFHRIKSLEQLVINELEGKQYTKVLSTFLEYVYELRSNLTKDELVYKIRQRSKLISNDRIKIIEIRSLL